MTLYRVRSTSDAAADGVVIEEVTHGGAAEEYAEPCATARRGATRRRTWCSASTAARRR
jgi:hypothetical protein